VCPVVEPDAEQHARLEPLPFRRPPLALLVGGRCGVGVAATGQPIFQVRMWSSTVLRRSLSPPSAHDLNGEMLLAAAYPAL
jgi:hypothetical protein